MYNINNTHPIHPHTHPPYTPPPSPHPHIQVYVDYHGHSRKKNVFLYGCSRNLSWTLSDSTDGGGGGGGGATSTRCSTSTGRRGDSGRRALDADYMDNVEVTASTVGGVALTVTTASVGDLRSSASGRTSDDGSFRVRNKKRSKYVVNKITKVFPPTLTECHVSLCDLEVLE